MKKLLFLFFISALSFSAFSQHVMNDLNVEKRSIGSFHGIEVATGVELFLTQGNVEEVAVSASKTEFRDKIVTKIENGVLKIHYDSKAGSVNKSKEAKNLKAYVSCKTLDKLHASTGAAVKIKGALRVTTLDMAASTGAKIDGEINATELRVDQNTGSKLELTGSVTKLEIKGNTGSKFSGEKLEATTCNVSVDTGAKISISAGKELYAKASTGGRIWYKGAATIKEIKKNTGGTVSKI